MQNKQPHSLVFFLILFTCSFSASAQVSVDFKTPDNPAVDLKNIEVNTELGLAIVKQNSELTLKGISNPDKIIFDYTTINENGTKIQISKKVGAAEVVLQTFTLQKSAVTTASEPFLLQLPEKVDLVIRLYNASSGEALNVYTIRVYSLSDEVVETMKMRKVLAEWNQTADLNMYNTQVTNLVDLSKRSFNNIYDVYHRQNHLLMELRIADFMNARNALSNPISYQKFNDMIANLKKTSSDSISNEFLKNLEYKLQNKTNKFQNTLSSVLSIGGSILNGFSGGAVSGIFNSIKTIANTVSSQREKIYYGANGMVEDVRDLSKDKFMDKYNKGYKDFKVMNVMLDKLEEDKWKIDYRLQKIVQTASILDLQQARILEFAANYHSRFSLGFDKNTFIETSKLLTDDLNTKLDPEYNKIRIYVESLKAPTNINSETFESKKRTVNTIVAINAESLTFKSVYYDNSKLIYGNFLDFADDLQNDVLINAQEAKGLDAAYVTQINQDYAKHRTTTVKAYCDLIGQVKITLTPPSDLAEKSVAVNKICPNTFTEANLAGNTNPSK